MRLSGESEGHFPWQGAGLQAKELNRAAYTVEQPLDEGDYKTGFLEASKHRLPKHLKLHVNAEHVNSWWLRERKKDLKHTQSPPELCAS